MVILGFRNGVCIYILVVFDERVLEECGKLEGKGREEVCYFMNTYENSKSPVHRHGITS